MIEEPLFETVGKLLDGQPNDDVVPALITLSARALVEEAGSDYDALAKHVQKFCSLLTNQAVDMWKEDHE